MALSAKMLSVLQKVDAAQAAHFAGLRATAKRETQARAKATEKMMRARRAAKARAAKKNARLRQVQGPRRGQPD